MLYKAVVHYVQDIGIADLEYLQGPGSGLLSYPGLTKKSDLRCLGSELCSSQNTFKVFWFAIHNDLLYKLYIISGGLWSILWWDWMRKPWNVEWVCTHLFDDYYFLYMGTNFAWWFFDHWLVLYGQCQCTLCQKSQQIRKYTGIHLCSTEFFQVYFPRYYSKSVSESRIFSMV